MPATHEQNKLAQEQRLQSIGVWSGFAFIILFSIGWFGFARFYPPLHPNLTAEALATSIQRRRVQYELGAVCIMVSTVILLPFSALVVLLMRRIEGRVGMITLMMGFTLCTNLISNFFTGFFLSAAAFRPNRDPQTTQLTTDLAFLLLMGGIALFVMAWFLSAYAILVVSPRSAPVLPRWTGYLSLWAGLLMLPELLIYFFRTGPFAWDGFVGFWIPAFVFIGFFAGLSFILAPVVRRLPARL